MTTDRYRHRAIEITALQWNPGSLVDVARVVGPLLGEGVDFRHPSGEGATTTLLIDTPEGEQLAQPGDWIIRVDGGDWAVMGADDFAERYEPAVPPGCWYNAEAAEKAMWTESTPAAVPVPPPADQTACPDPIECGHEAALGEAQQQTRRLSLMVDEYAAGASALTGKLKRLRELHRETCILARGDLGPPAFTCGMCEALDAPAVAVLPEQADRAALLRREADQIRAHCPDHLDSDSAPGAWMVCHCDVADDMMRRLAGSPQPEAQEAPRG